MRPYFDAFKASLKSAWAGRYDSVTVAFFCAVILIVFGELWAAAMPQIDGHRSTIAGYSYKAILWYLAATEAVVFAVPSRRIEDIGRDISEGSIEIEMLRPVSVLGFRLARELGDAMLRMLLCWLVGVIVVTPFAGPPPSALGTLLAVPVSVIAVMCDFLAVYAFAAVAFWLRDAKATWFLYQKLVFLPGGMLIPIQLLPHWLQAVSFVLPFWTMAFAAGHLMAGHIELKLIVGQLAWLVVLYGLAAFAFSQGQRKLVRAQ
jgi:ABC-2 type transport system permease protein